MNEAEKLGWFTIPEAVSMIERGEIVGAATVVAIYRALTLAVVVRASSIPREAATPSA